MSAEIDALVRDRADWLVDAVATSTQDRRYLRGDPECDQVACDSIRMNGELAIRAALRASLARIGELEAALAPFAAYAPEDLPPLIIIPDGHPILFRGDYRGSGFHVAVTVGDFRAARAALAGDAPLASIAELEAGAAELDRLRIARDTDGFLGTAEEWVALLMQEREAAVDALRPFAAEAAGLPVGLSDGERYRVRLSADSPESETVESEITVGDVRRAHAVWEGLA